MSLTNLPNIWWQEKAKMTPIHIIDIFNTLFMFVVSFIFLVCLLCAFQQKSFVILFISTNSEEFLQCWFPKITIVFQVSHVNSCCYASREAMHCEQEITILNKYIYLYFFHFLWLWSYEYYHISRIQTFYPLYFLITTQHFIWITDTYMLYVNQSFAATQSCLSLDFLKFWFICI